MAQSTLSFWFMELGIVEIEESVQEHFFRVQALTVGKGFYIEIILEPVD